MFLSLNKLVFTKKTLDPRTKLILLVFIATLTTAGDITGKKIFFRLLLGLVPGILLSFDKYWKQGLGYSLIFILAWWSESYLVANIHGNTGMFLLLVAGVITRFFPAFMMGFYFIKTTEVDYFISALNQWHIPNNLTIPIAVVFRFIPTIAEESKSINKAMKIRNLNKSTIFKKPIKYFEYRIVPLLSGLVRIGDNLSAAALTRGLGLKLKRTTVYRVKFVYFDYCMIFFTFFCVLGYLYF